MGIPTIWSIARKCKILDWKPPHDWLCHLQCTQKRLTPLQTLANYSVSGSETVKNGKWIAFIFTVKVGLFVRHNLHSEGEQKKCKLEMGSPSPVCIVLFYYYMLRATVISCLGPERSQGSAAHSVQLSSPSDCQQPPIPSRRPELDVAYVQNWSLGCVTEGLVDIKTETMCRSTVIKWTTGSKPAALCIC